MWGSVIDTCQLRGSNPNQIFKFVLSENFSWYCHKNYWSDPLEGYFILNELLKLLIICSLTDHLTDFCVDLYFFFFPWKAILFLSLIFSCWQSKMSFLLASCQLLLCEIRQSLGEINDIFVPKLIRQRFARYQIIRPWD